MGPALLADTRVPDWIFDLFGTVEAVLFSRFSLSQYFWFNLVGLGGR
jgi:hypothetical protein